jgi:hypothetical protein
LLYGQQPRSINNTRSVLDDIGNIASVALGQYTPVLTSNQRRGCYGFIAILWAADESPERTQSLG